jgi:hypothetical protein
VRFDDVVTVSQRVAEASGRLVQELSPAQLAVHIAIEQLEDTTIVFWSASH